MGNAIFQFEIKTWLKSPLFYLLAGSFFFFSLVSILGTGGFFDGPVNANEGVKLLNSPYSLCSMNFLFAKLLLFVIAILGGFSLYRDYRNKIHSIIYSFPISKSFYLSGKLGSVLLLVFLFSLLTLAGIWIGELMLGTENPRIGSNSSLGYIITLCIYLFPTLAIIGVMVFVVVGFSRNIFSGFIVVICFVLFQLILENVFFEQKVILALLDPFGQNAFQLATYDWDFTAQNTNRLPVNLMVIGNRVLWSLMALLIYRLFFKKFDFQYDAVWQFNHGSLQRSAPSVDQFEQDHLDQEIHFDFSIKAKLKCTIQLMIHDFMSIMKDWMFQLLCLFGGATVFFIQLKVSITGEFNLFPLTRLFIGAPLSIYTLIIILNTFIFSGILVKKAGQHKMNLMLDATPIKDWQLMLSKIGAIFLMQLTQLFLFILIGIIIQMINGYHNFEIGLYFFHLFILVLPLLFVWNLTSQFVHTLIPNLFLGLFILAGLWLGAQSLDQLNIHTNTLKFNYLPALEYSDFNGYGHQLKGYLLLLFYWLVFGFTLALGTLLLWYRGSMSSVKERYLLAMSKFNKFLLVALMLFSLSFIFFGWKIHSAENLDNKSMGAINSSQIFTDYKKEWEQYGRITQPMITDIDLKIDLFPNEENFIATGVYNLENQSDKSIDTIFIRTGYDEITELDWNGNAQLLRESREMKSHLYQLSNSLHPGESIELTFTIRNTPNRIFSRNSNVLKNGTYLQHDILPRLGYLFVDHELPLSDSMVNSINYFHRDANYVNIQTTISTSENQVAIAPGELIAESREEGRNIFKYRSPKPVKLNFSFHSAQFESIEEVHEGIAIQMYYLKGHERNTGLMLEGIKASIKYNTKWFGKYPYQELRIIEFPHTEASYSATLTSNNIPVSETLFSINTETMDHKINLPFYVMAHELTHEWFGNTVMPADAEGAKMLTESITEYITLCIYREHFGEAFADHFLDLQRSRYNRGWKREKGKERSLNQVLSHQEYLAYGKGALAFNAISKSIGQEKFNSILMSYLKKYSSQLNNFPTSDNFIEILKSNTSKEHHRLIDHWLTQTEGLNSLK